MAFRTRRFNGSAEEGDDDADEADDDKEAEEERMSMADSESAAAPARGPKAAHVGPDGDSDRAVGCSPSSRMGHLRAAGESISAHEARVSEAPRLQTARWKVGHSEQLGTQAPRLHAAS